MVCRQSSTAGLSTKMALRLLFRLRSSLLNVLILETSLKFGLPRFAFDCRARDSGNGEEVLPFRFQ